MSIVLRLLEMEHLKLLLIQTQFDGFEVKVIVFLTFDFSAQSQKQFLAFQKNLFHFYYC